VPEYPQKSAHQHEDVIDKNVNFSHVDHAGKKKSRLLVPALGFETQNIVNLFL
jgi:hypothetical protein